jgi:hypothetical protein
MTEHFHNSMPLWIPQFHWNFTLPRDGENIFVDMTELVSVVSHKAMKSYAISE